MGIWAWHDLRWCSLSSRLWAWGQSYSNFLASVWLQERRRTYPRPDEGAPLPMSYIRYEACGPKRSPMPCFTIARNPLLSSYRLRPGIPTLGLQIFQSRPCSFTAESRKEHDRPPTPNQNIKENQHKSSYIHVPSFWSLLYLRPNAAIVCMLGARRPGKNTKKRDSIQVALNKKAFCTK